MQKRRKIKNKLRIIYVLAGILFLAMGVGYSYLNSSLGASGSAVFASKWNIAFENLNVSPESVKTYEYSASDASFYINLGLKKPNDFYSFTIDLHNSGTVDAMISEINKSTLSYEEQKYLEFITTYADGSPIRINDKIPAGTTKKLYILIKYKDDASSYYYPEVNQTLSFNFSLKFKQAKSFNLEYINNETKILETDRENNIISIENVNNNFNVIACNNDVLPRFVNGKLTISNINNDSKCITYNSLKDALEETDETINNVILINDAFLDDTIYIGDNKNIIIDLNGKNIKSNTNKTLIENHGNLKIKDSENKAIIQGNNNLIENYNELVIYSTKFTSNAGNILNIKDGTVAVLGSYMESFKEPAIVYSTNKNVTRILNINNSTIKSTSSIIAYESSNEEDSYTNIFNSTLVANTVATYNENLTNLYLCNNNITATTDIFSELSHGKVFYSKDNIFSTGGPISNMPDTFYLNYKNTCKMNK